MIATLVITPLFLVQAVTALMVEQHMKFAD